MASAPDNDGKTLPEDTAASAAGGTLVEDPAAPVPEVTLSPDEAAGAQSSCGNGAALAAGASSSSGAGVEGSEENLAHADDLFEKGSKAIEDGDFVEAVDCLSRALEIRVAHYGELAQECASSYYKYGCALLCKAQEETDPLGNVPKNNAANLEKVKSDKSMECGETSKAADIQAGDNKENEGGVGCNEKNQDDGNVESEEDDEELAEAEEEEEEEGEEPDLDLAWKMLDIARAIVERQPEDSIEKANIFSALGEISMEREDIETSLSDYLKALSILERVVEPDHRRVVDLNFRICLVLEVGTKVGEAIPYCQKAISLCKSRIQRLGDARATDEGSRKSDLEDEMELLKGILTELEKKFEDLEQGTSNPTSVVSEVMKMLLASKPPEENNPPNATAKSSPLTSSQPGVVSNGFDSPTISTAATQEGSIVTHLGVVGRGIKRATLKPSGTEPDSSKRHMGDSAAEQVDRGTSAEVVGPANRETESV